MFALNRKFHPVESDIGLDLSYVKIRSMATMPYNAKKRYQRTVVQMYGTTKKYQYEYKLWTLKY